MFFFRTILEKIWDKYFKLLDLPVLSLLVENFCLHYGKIVVILLILVRREKLINDKFIIPIVQRETSDAFHLHFDHGICASPCTPRQTKAWLFKMTLR